MRRICFTLVLLLAWFVQPAPVTAQDPDSKPALRLPLPGGQTYTVSCGYGCYQHKRSMTHAVDFDVPVGTPVVAAGNGVVSAITWEMGLPSSLHLGDALIVYIDHGNGWFTRYVHLDGITVKVGQVVQSGEIIGYAGETGASAPHLHFELKYGESLHAPSQPIDDLFGGSPPESGAVYKSQNALVPSIATTEALETLPTTTPAPSPTPANAPQMVAVNRENSPTAPLTLVETLTTSQADIAFGQPVTVSFTLRNDSVEPVTLGLVGVGARSDDNELAPGSLSLARGISIVPGDTYTFRRVHVYNVAGDLELFLFTFSPDYELLPIGIGVDALQPRTLLHVNDPEHAVFLPLIH